MTCGCNQPFNDHGDPKNLTKDRFTDAGKTRAAGGSKTASAAIHMTAATHRRRK